MWNEPVAEHHGQDLWVISTEELCLYRFAVLLKPHTYIGESNCPVPLHNSLHLIQRPVIPAAELEAQTPVGGQRWQSHELQVENKNPAHCQWMLCVSPRCPFP